MPPLLLFGTVRESCLEVVLELLSGTLSGMTLGKDKTKSGECGTFAMVIHIAHFIAAKEFRESRYVGQVKSSQPADGSTEILMPGERAFKEHEKRLREGIPVAEAISNDTKALADELGVDLKQSIGSI